MKRSEINSYIDEAIVFFDSLNFRLPVWGYWSIDEWKSKVADFAEIKDNGLGWDLTDFGKGDFFKEGLLLFTVRNGNLLSSNKNSKSYAEKIMISKVDQVTPIHFHFNKMEDIINRGGGNLILKFWKSDENEELSTDKVIVKKDGIPMTLNAGEEVSLLPGESVCIEPFVYHTFWAEKAPCMIGEVSMVNDDTNDNRFLEPTGRFPEIEEDILPNYLLAQDYNKMGI
jgi:D-lyxose ketol-isomerase